MNDKKQMSLTEMAKELGLSRTTVSRAMSGTGRIGSETRERVRRFAYTKGGYRRDDREEGTHNIALVLPENWKLTEFAFFQRSMAGIIEAAAEAGYRVLVVMSNEGEASQVRSLVEEEKVDGFILARTYRQDACVRCLKQWGKPFVTLGSMDDPEVIQVDHDHEAACRELTVSLLQKGVKRLALVGSNRNHMVSNARLSGYSAGLEEMNIRVNPDYVFLNGENRLRIENIVHGILLKKADGILCMDDVLCRWIIMELRRKKIRIPGQVKVAACYDSELLEDYTPSVTSIKFDAEELGVTACRVLLQKVQGKDVEIRTLLGYEIRYRDSTKK